MRRIVITIALSSVVHAAMVMWLDIDFRGFRREPPEALQIVLQEVVALEEALEPVFAEPEPEPQSEPESDPETKPESIAEEEPVPPVEVVPNLRERLITSIRQDNSGAAYQAFRQAECTGRESHSERDPCKEPAAADARAGFYAALFREAMGHVTVITPSVAKKLDRVDGLLREMDTLAAVAAEDPAQQALIREQRRHLQSEIMRIDQGLASVNLLKLIPMARKAAKGLKNLGKE